MEVASAFRHHNSCFSRSIKPGSLNVTPRRRRFRFKRFRAMEGRIAHHTMLLFLCFLFMSGTKNAENTHTTSMRGSQEVFVFPSSSAVVQRDTEQGNIPVVNPTTPGTTPIVNPTSPIPVPPIPPATTGPYPTAPGSTGGSWCIANPTASQTALQVALDYACGYGGTDCSAIQPNGPCWDPNTVADHASYAFNDYYQKNPVPTSCVFGGAAQLTNTDPSRGNCHFAAPTSTPAMPPPTPMPPPATPMVQPPPSPTMPYTPGGDNGDTGSSTQPIDGDYGAEPTGEPSSAETPSANLGLVIITICCLVMPLAMASHV
ncbi:hypothetical protein C2S52_014313 [Perilla frutescens var. hirtella]|nr:hypothetical protein C2S52_014313 [Perilla frutescens var. hirtella]